jgi:hypothetical protein
MKLTTSGSPSRKLNQSTKISAPVSSIGNSRCFSFLLANNTSNQFGICLTLPRTFHDKARGVTVNCEYCVCIVTKFPFLSYIFNLLMQFDILGGLEFLEPVHRQETLAESILLGKPSVLRMLIDLASQLHEIRVPLYRLGRRAEKDSTYISFESSLREDGPYGDSEHKGSYQPVNFSICFRSVSRKGSPIGSFEIKVIDALNPLSSSPTINRSLSPVSTTLFASLGSMRRGKSYKESVNGVFRRDLMGLYSALPLVPSFLHKNIPSASFPEPPFLPNARWLADDSLLGLLEEDREKEVCFHTLMWALPALLRHLPLDQIILAVGCALTEMRLVVVGSDLGVVSGCVLALVNLLRPLKWAGPVIVTLPSSLHAYLGEDFFSYDSCYYHFLFSL